MAFSFCSPPLLSLACARAGTCPIYSSPLLIEAGVGDAFSTLESAYFRIDHACSMYKLTFHDIVSRTRASGWAYARTRSRHTTINFTPHPSLAPSLCSKSRTDSNVVHVTHRCFTHHNLPHTQCFFVSFFADVGWFIWAVFSHI